jgi:hypothetical protein
MHTPQTIKHTKYIFFPFVQREGATGCIAYATRECRSKAGEVLAV